MVGNRRWCSRNSLEASKPAKVAEHHLCWATHGTGVGEAGLAREETAAAKSGSSLNGESDTSVSTW